MMRFIGSMNFYSKFIKELHISLKPFCSLHHDDVSFEWTPDLDKLFNEIKISLSKDAKLAISSLLLSAEHAMLEIYSTVHRHI